jgi:hypothetical protein
MNLYQKIIWFSSCILLILGTFIGGIILSLGIDQDIRDHSETGYIIDIHCEQVCGWNCDWSIIFNINYTIDNINYNGFYVTDFFEECKPPAFPEKLGFCCENLYGMKIWLDVSSDNSSVIKTIDIEQEYSTGLHISLVVGLFLFSVCSLCVFIIYTRKIYKSQYSEILLSQYQVPKNF